MYIHIYVCARVWEGRVCARGHVSTHTFGVVETCMYICVSHICVFFVYMYSRVFAFSFMHL